MIPRNIADALYSGLRFYDLKQDIRENELQLCLILS